MQKRKTAQQRTGKVYKSKIVLIFMLLLLFPVQLRAAVTEVILSVSLRTASLEDQITLTVMVHGDNKAAKPEIGSIEHFDVNFSGRSSRIEIINGKMRSAVEYSYDLFPKKPGRFRIGPAVVVSDGRKITSNVVSILVRKPSVREKAASNLFVTVNISKVSPYLYEPVVYTFKLYRRISISDIKFSRPSFEGFSLEAQEDEVTYHETLNGLDYNVSELKFYLLPRRSGKLVIDAPVIVVGILERSGRRQEQFGFGGFDIFGGVTGARVRSKRLAVQHVELTVIPLPVEGKDEFFTNLVGEFTVSSSISSQRLMMGDSATLDILIRGTGNITDMVEPQFNDTGAFKVYDDKLAINQVIGQNGLFGEVLIKKAIVPVQPGNLTVPSFTYKYFSPASGKYRLLKTPAYQIMVDPASGETIAAGVSQAGNNVPPAGQTGEKQGEEIKITGRDIFPVHTRIPESLDESFVIFTPFNILLILASPFLCISSLFLIHRKERYLSDNAYRRSRTARKTAVKQLESLTSAMEMESFFMGVEKVVKEYLGNKLNRTGGAMTGSEIVECLVKENIPAAEVELLLNQLQTYNFAGGHVQEHEKEEVLIAAKNMINTVEKAIK